MHRQGNLLQASGRLPVSCMWQVSMGPLGAARAHHKTLVQPYKPNLPAFPALAASLASTSSCKVLSDKVATGLLL